MLTDELRSELKNMAGFRFREPKDIEVTKGRLEALSKILNLQLNKILLWFVKEEKVTYTESTYKAVQVFPLLGHIGDAPVHWHEETSSCGGILLSEENARLYQCWQANSTLQWSPDMWHPAVSPEVKGYADDLHLTIWAAFHGNSSEFRSFLFPSDASSNDRSNRYLQKSSLPVILRWYPLIAPLRGLAFLSPFFQGCLQ